MRVGLIEMSMWSPVFQRHHFLPVVVPGQRTMAKRFVATGKFLAVL